MKKIVNTRWIKLIFLQVFALIWLALPCFSQTGQVSIPRIDQMPNLPTPYLMRDWKQVAAQYDAFVFDKNKTGQFLPLVKLKSSGNNFPALQPILLDTYVGTNSISQAEAINIIPALVGASLVNIDKSNQAGINWVEKANDFYNSKNGQNIYLNGYATVSGNDWWYDLMPNIFFYQLYAKYPATINFNSQFTIVADRWLSAVHAMGGSASPWTIPQMNYRGWYFASMTPNTQSVPEPESAGSIAWLLYHAYLKTGQKKYLTGAQLAMEFLSKQTANPSYELQLPYGSFIAAKMNAELGTRYDIGKMINWSFNRGALRGWGTIVGKWNGADVSGLVGEANDGGNDYAFALNGFQHAAALVPLVKYDKRFARAISKWVLNLANASRFFYPGYLPPTSQDDFAWSSVNDPQSVIGYEALKENLNGKKLFGTGDAKTGGWAQTNLGIYGSSSVGYMASLIEKTDVNGILLLDVNKTDFFGQNVYPTFLVYNPGPTTQITLPLAANSYDIYDAISETILYTNATGNYPIIVAANEVKFLVYLPIGSTPITREGKLYIGDNIIDYHYGYNFNGKFRIRALTTQDTLIQFNQAAKLFCSVENRKGSPTYQWYVNNTLTKTTQDSTYTWNAPEVAGTYQIALTVTSGTSSAKDSLQIKVVQRFITPPSINGITKDSLWYSTNQVASLICRASNADGTKLQYLWTIPSGSIVEQKDSLIRWKVPSSEGLFQVSCRVTNRDALTASSNQLIVVKKTSTGVTPPLAYYPLDGDVNDYSGNGRHGKLQGARPATDALGIANKAFQFTSGSDVIYINNDAGLNFRDQITLSCWIKLDQLTQESYVISHGSYEERWKLSVIPNSKLRWTIKTTNVTVDLDSSFPLALNTFYHIAVVYTGYSMELYVNGILNNYAIANGLMSTTAKELTFARKDLGITNFSFRGTLDEIRIYDKALSPREIATLKTVWNTVTETSEEPLKELTIFPNPAEGSVQVEGLMAPVRSVTVFDVTGRIISSSWSNAIDDKKLIIEYSAFGYSLLLVKIETDHGIIYKKIIHR